MEAPPGYTGDLTERDMPTTRVHPLFLQRWHCLMLRTSASGREIGFPAGWRPDCSRKNIKIGFWVWALPIYGSGAHMAPNPMNSYGFCDDHFAHTGLGGSLPSRAGVGPPRPGETLDFRRACRRIGPGTGRSRWGPHRPLPRCQVEPLRSRVYLDQSPQ